MVQVKSALGSTASTKSVISTLSETSGDAELAILYLLNPKIVEQQKKVQTNQTHGSHVRSSLFETTDEIEEQDTEHKVIDHDEQAISLIDNGMSFLHDEEGELFFVAIIGGAIITAFYCLYFVVVVERFGFD